MSITKQYTFTNPLEYICDPALIEISSGEAKLNLVDYPDLDFVEDFVDDTGFIYDNTKAEFSAGVCRQKDQRSANATFGATYTSSINGNWGGGTLTGTAFGGATVGLGKLDLKGGTVKYVDYSGTGNADSPQVGCIRFKYTPNYSGVPASDQNMFCISLGLDNDNNSLAIRHNSVTGNIFLRTCSSTGNYIDANVQVGAWSPISGTEYEIEYNYDFTAGAGRIFINGVQIGSTTTSTGTRTSSIGNIRIGNFNTSNFTANFEINDFEIFSTVQHIANYTSGYVLPEYIYLENAVTCPEMEYTGAGTLVSFDDFTTSEVGTPRYTLQIGRSGNYLYWSGSVWATSNGTYSQSNDATIFKANLSTLDIYGDIYGQFKIHFQNSTTQSNISELTATLTAQIYPVTNPSLTLAQNIRLESLINFIETVTKIGDDNIKYVLNKDTIPLYWSGSAWVTSNETYTQSNTASEIITNCASFTTEPIDFNFKIYLHSDDGQTTPSIQQLDIIYDYAGGDEDDYNICDVYWYSRKPDGTVDTEQYIVRLNVQKYVKYKNNIIINGFTQIVIADQNGYCEISLIDNVNMVEDGVTKVYYTVERAGITIAKIYVPETSGELLWDIEI